MIEKIKPMIGTIDCTSEGFFTTSISAVVDENDEDSDNDSVGKVPLVSCIFLSIHNGGRSNV